MKLCILGGLKRRENDYVDVCARLGCKAKVFNEVTKSFEDNIKCTDCVVFLTGMSSHNMLNAARKICRKRGINFVVTDKTSPESVSGVVRDVMTAAGR